MFTCMYTHPDTRTCTRTQKHTCRRSMCIVAHSCAHTQKLTPLRLQVKGERPVSPLSPAAAPDQLSPPSAPMMTLATVVSRRSNRGRGAGRELLHARRPRQSHTKTWSPAAARCGGKPGSGDSSQDSCNSPPIEVVNSGSDTAQMQLVRSNIVAVVRYAVMSELR